MKPDPDEPAFPTTAVTHGSGQVEYLPHGMTIRQHFAVLALTGMLADSCRDTPYSVSAEQAVRYADELILALNKEPHDQTKDS